MQRMTFRPYSRHMDLPGIRIVSFGSPLYWFGAGLSDLLRSWPISLSYGIVFAALGYLLVNFAWTWLHLALALTTGTCLSG